MIEIINLIEEIYSNNKGFRSKKIEELQLLIENTDFSSNEKIEFLLVKLSESLDFFVENPNNRNEDPSYFGEKELKNRLFYFLISLEKIKNDKSIE